MTEPVASHPAGASTRNEWPDLGALVRYIVDLHHSYVRAEVPAINTGLNHLVNAHGHAHPELHQVRQVFSQLGADLLAHMEKEENILFPYIDELVAADRRTGPFPPSPFGTVANPVRMMEDEHQDALAGFERLRTLTANFAEPFDWPRSDAATLAALARFGMDLIEHIRLEDTILFPRALDLEARLT